MKILIKTNSQRKVEVLNLSTLEPIEGIGRIDIYVNTYGRANAVITFRDVNIDIESTSNEDT